MIAADLATRGMGAESQKRRQAACATGLRLAPRLLFVLSAVTIY